MNDKMQQDEIRYLSFVSLSVYLLLLQFMVRFTRFASPLFFICFALLAFWAYKKSPFKIMTKENRLSLILCIVIWIICAALIFMPFWDAWHQSDAEFRVKYKPALMAAWIIAIIITNPIGYFGGKFLISLRKKTGKTKSTLRK